MELVREPLVLDPRNPVDVRGPLAHERSRAGRCRRARKRSSGAARAAARIVSRPWSGISLPTKSARERLLGRPAGAEEPLLGADEADLDALRGKVGELGQVVGVCTRVGDDEVGRCGARAGRPPRALAPASEPARKRPRSATNVSDERDERVEDDRPPARGAPGRRKVEVPRVADDHASKSPWGRRSSRSSASASRAAAPAPALQLSRLPLPDGDVVLRDLDARPGAGTRSPARFAGSRARRSRSRGRASAESRSYL